MTIELVLLIHAINKEGTSKDTWRLSGRILENDMNDAGRFLNLILGLALDIQNRLFEYFISILYLLVHETCKEGDFDSGIVDINFKDLLRKYTWIPCLGLKLLYSH